MKCRQRLHAEHKNRHIINGQNDFTKDTESNDDDDDDCTVDLLDLVDPP